MDISYPSPLKFVMLENMTETTRQPTTEQHIATSSNQLNKLRAAVLGANDGIVSTAGIILGVAGAAASKETILIAGVAGMVAGALSMAAGEFVSVSSQRDSEKAFLEKSRNQRELGDTSNSEELVQVYVEKGISKKTAALVVSELHKKQLVDIELEKESGIDPDDISSPWAAAVASASSFVVGALVPLAAVALAPDSLRIWATVIAVILSLILAGTLSARAGQANKQRAALRIVVWGIGAMVITYAIGHLVGISL